jgi:hypothetical protein
MYRAVTVGYRRVRYSLLVFPILACCEGQFVFLEHRRSERYTLAGPNNRLRATANSRSEERAEAIGGRPQA